MARQQISGSARPQQASVGRGGSRQAVEGKVLPPLECRGQPVASPERLQGDSRRSGSPPEERLRSISPAGTGMLVGPARPGTGGGAGHYDVGYAAEMGMPMSIKQLGGGGAEQPKRTGSSSLLLPPDLRDNSRRVGSSSSMRRGLPGTQSTPGVVAPG